ncbi:hypothetical protein BUALT_Bualt02G0174000 [Buddleja alternifolia]|uniref:BZIP domain-containing protein n=1 Tax=Buddleja alternifolia TaxID=168488 RepID=A0AAV6Y7R0_9LAMI|nr:hypothetical protein BUALT_Bualt02G0174000 [Buddleja alternifolia]
MGIQTMNSHMSGGGHQQSHVRSPMTRQNSWFSLTLDEVKNQLGDFGKPLGSMNVDELLKNVMNAEASHLSGMDPISTSPAASLQRQASLSLAKAFSGKTVDEVWRDIQRGQMMRNAENREPTLGETTLEDFLVKAGLNVANSALAPVMSLDSALKSQSFSPQMGLSPSPSIDALSDDTPTPGRKRHSGDLEKAIERRLRRKIKNRESAARSRARKQAWNLRRWCVVIFVNQELRNPTLEMLKKKVAGRGETMAASYAFGPLEDDIIIKHRLLTRTTTTRGEPPLKKLQKKFTAFTVEVEKEADNYGDCERLAKAFLQELNTFEIPLMKSKAVIDSNVREKENFNELKDEINRQILQAQGDIEDLKKQLEESKIERQHKEECEAIRKLIDMQPPRSKTQKTITELENEIAMLEAENTAGSRTLDLRKKQFALLLHVMYKACILVRRQVDELQNTIEEEQRSLMEEMRTSIDEHRTGLEDASGGPEAMALD